MKVVATVCEYNPLHNGHIKHLQYIKDNFTPDCIVVFMSGNFVQRGEGAICDKYTRAKWAISAGADIVIELPTVFAVANAERFGTGAIKLMHALNTPLDFCFGSETADKDAFITNAKLFLNESKELKTKLKENLAQGYSFAKARYEALKSIAPNGFNSVLFENPNNILGIEYTKAVLKYNAKIDICPMARPGDHTDNTLYKKTTSASSIRQALGNVKKGKLKSVMPKFVYDQLPERMPNFELGIMTTILNTPSEVMKLTPDCTEGLENRIKLLTAENGDYQTALKKITTKRYTESRIRRICICNMLGITERLVSDCLEDNLYFKVLATNSNGLNFIGKVKDKAKYPFLTRKSDYSALTKTALKSFEIDTIACNIYSLFTGEKQNEYHTIITQ